MPTGSAASAQRGFQTAWLSKGLAALVRDIDKSRKDQPTRDFDFDVLIVGSGYGASIAAAGLAGCKDEQGGMQRICLLERGKEYLAGAFPNLQANIFGHARFASPSEARARGTLDALYDIRLSGDAAAVIACGLGGGSLINAGVMAKPHWSIFEEARWPEAIRKDAASDELDKHYELARKWLQPRVVIDVRPPGSGKQELAKTTLMKRLAVGDEFRKLGITVADKAFTNVAGVALDRCHRCGDCATGCNKNAKNSLDLNLLRLAEQAGVRIVTGATVLRLEPLEGASKGWRVYVNHTSKHLRDRQKQPFTVRARRVILAAGTFGSTEILMRSTGVKCSAQLGRKFSANGDMLVTAFGMNAPGNAIADETVDPGETPHSPDRRAIGPTITSMIDVRTGDPDTDVVIQDLAVPGPLSRLFEEITTTADVINRLVAPDKERHDGSVDRPDEAAVNPQAMANSLVLAMIGRDDAEGELVTSVDKIGDEADGLLTVKWPGLRADPRFSVHHKELEERLGESGLGGRVVSNLLWRPLSSKLEEVFGEHRGPLVTVHPLGGCAMGNNVREGVTNDIGQVFDAGSVNGLAVHDGLAVLDGSIVPASLGINPALTISALTLRALDGLKKQWSLQGQGLSSERFEQLKARNESAEKGAPRPAFTNLAAPRRPKKTKVELSEQMRGTLHLANTHGIVRPHEVELTLTTEPTIIDDLVARSAGEDRRLLLTGTRGRLRILRTGASFDRVSDLVNDNDVLLTAEVSGEIRLFRLARSSRVWRILRALFAWVCNRGIRDVAQDFIRRLAQSFDYAPPAVRPRQSIITYLRYITGVLSHAGAARLIEYELKIEDARFLSRVEDEAAPNILRKRKETEAEDGFTIDMFLKRRVSGYKRITYARATSPLTQVSQMSLNSFPRLRWRRSAILKFNPRFLARRGVPLLRIVDQEDRVSALSDLLRFSLYVVRILLQVHAFSFRKPDPPVEREPQRLPGRLKDLPPPQIDWLTVGKDPCLPARIRLARYGRHAVVEGARQRPVLLIHGYSASGTTFAHPSVPGSLVETLVKRGRDVWVLDMRSSAGLPTATTDWKFEDMASEDIPIAIDYVSEACGGQKVDVVGHCMGAAMFSMAVLGEDDATSAPSTLAQKIGRVVLSQVGPAMLLSSDNVFRAYVMRYVRQFLPLQDYQFSVTGEPSTIDGLLDRMLYPMTMDKDEFKRENPMWPLGVATPWVGSRHRMDALYARTFSLNNLTDDVLDHFDDFFGPLSVETMSQVIHFAALKTVTDAAGVNRYVLPKRLEERLRFPIMSIHGEDNGLVDVGTLELMRTTLGAAGIPYLNEPLLPKSTSRCQTPEKMRMLIRKKASLLGPRNPSYMTWRIKGHGHQDCLIGRHAGEICGVIADYLGAVAVSSASQVAEQASLPADQPEPVK